MYVILSFLSLGKPVCLPLAAQLNADWPHLVFRSHVGLVATKLQPSEWLSSSADENLKHDSNPASL